MREERGKVEFSLKFMKNMYSSGRDFLFFFNDSFVRRKRDFIKKLFKNINYTSDLIDIKTGSGIFLKQFL